jgi:hypothetical protein
MYRFNYIPLYVYYNNHEVYYFLALEKIILAHDALAIQADVGGKIIRKFRSADFTEPCHVI